MFSFGKAHLLDVEGVGSIAVFPGIGFDEYGKGKWLRAVRLYGSRVPEGSACTV